MSNKWLSFSTAFSQNETATSDHPVLLSARNIYTECGERQARSKLRDEKEVSGFNP